MYFFIFIPSHTFFELILYFLILCKEEENLEGIAHIQQYRAMPQHFYLDLLRFYFGLMYITISRN